MFASFWLFVLLNSLFQQLVGGEEESGVDGTQTTSSRREDETAGTSQGRLGQVLRGSPGENEKENGTKQVKLFFLRATTFCARHVINGYSIVSVSLYVYVCVHLQN